MISYGNKMRALWAFNLITLGYSIYALPQYFWYGLAWALFVSLIGSTAGFHRYFSHRSFTARNKFVYHMMLWMGVFGTSGKPITTAVAHRLHHKYSDTEKDIHSPKNIGTWNVFWGFWDTIPYEKSMMKDLVEDPNLKFAQKWYFHIILGANALVFLYNPALVGYVLGFPAVYSQLIIGSLIINILNHKMGSRPHETTDDSRNSLILSIFSHGEGWHNNHHNNGRSYTSQEEWWQFDLTGVVIKYFLSKGELGK